MTEPQIDTLAASLIDNLLRDLGERFPSVGVRMKEIDADLYGFKAEKAETVADNLKRLFERK